jgi:4-diphosphocytidyl-2-C-methyl-D-erythritol kinase
MLIFPNAKINIGLNIVSKRNDGFHNIETLFFPVRGLTDAVEFIPSKKTILTTSGIKIAGNLADNLVLKAYYLLKDRFRLPPLTIHLHKFIPSGAGLGGGSSDASFMLNGLKEYFQLSLNQKDLTELAGQLGSDCAFFILNEPAMASGKGEILQPVSPGFSNKHFLIIKPPFSIETKEAYSDVKPSEPSRKLKDLIHLPIAEWKGAIQNDFELLIFKRFPELENIKQAMYEMGALYASMSGSGSAIFGIFESLPEIPRLPGNYFCWKT